MHAVVTPEEMRAIDSAAETDMGVLIARAGWAVARTARQMLGGSYGRRVTVLAGRGHNGADGLVAARNLQAWGVRTAIIRVDRATPAPDHIADCDLVIDAAFGTGFSGTFVAPRVGSIPVLAVDIPSGVDGLTGLVQRGSQPFICARTITFAALKPGLLFADGPGYCGVLEVADIGLETPSPVHVLDEATVRLRLPARGRAAHKWSAAVLVIGGSEGMSGAPTLTARAAMRTGAGMVRLGVPGEKHPSAGPFGAEVVGALLPAAEWEDAAVKASQKCGAVVVGPGLGRSGDATQGVRALLARTETLPTVVDADGLAVFPKYRIGNRSAAAGVVLTPHDGEYKTMTGQPAGDDRISAARRLAQITNAVVLLKGPVTVVADQHNRVELVMNGDSRLATAGSGDVLSGIIGALMAQGLPAFEAASTGAFVHGAASSLGTARGFIASDIIDHLPEWLSC